MKPAKKVVIVGSKFGEVYLNAFIQPQDKWHLIGLFSKGSTRSRELSKAFGIPLFTRFDQLPEKIDLACIVVRSAIVGGEGSQLAQAFLQRVISVVQEHPVHPDEITRLQSLAEKMHCHYIVNSLYPHNKAGRLWIENTQKIYQQIQQRPVWGQIITSRQLIYSALDIYCQAMKLHPNDITVTLEKDNTPLQFLRLSNPTGDLLLCLQKHLSSNDPDQHSLVMHHMILGWPAGYLTLAGSYGPVEWNNALYIHHHQDSKKAMYQSPATMELDEPLFHSFHTPPNSWQDVMECEAPEAINYLLAEIDKCWQLPNDKKPMILQPHYQLALSQLWIKTLQTAGKAIDGTIAPFKRMNFTKSSGRRK